ncbi:solanesyl diphosphate synthase, variant [Aphanomyces invadans]|uniref:Solanesyl diphosphate synthase, variant n=1 Tax=Aphanomyces invadans TaxID=157072 RepID=A0A024U4T7_9STRA|nr:solanesyl diphosphate synthase, variant [Aphanomyces invadans]ETW01260.1 solanesyl diphosphate synthase, variant [Aphanomyces invadans]|eukprot:XP_008870258.1 solanesyl diphosphate synthase, variant [Aphanomyces invadans]
MQRFLRSGSSIRNFSSLQTTAMKRVVGSLQQSVDIEGNTNLWLSAGAVDEPTLSILDPSPGFTAAMRERSFNLVDNFDLPINGSHSTQHIRQPMNVDPFALVKDSIVSVSANIKMILGSDHPVLEAVAKYFFENDGGKKIRPTMILLLSQAAEADRLAGQSTFPKSAEYIAASQQRLAEITEMIHTASLLHDDVIDEADTRRGMQSVNKVFGSKLSILAGDFLLARSSICLARLRSLEAVELMSTAIEHLVKGEVMQMRHADKSGAISPFEYYLRKNYYKTGSLMANSCKASLVLGDHTDRVCELGFAYGRHLGLAFQLIDDVLDYSGQNTGKPMLADLKAVHCRSRSQGSHSNDALGLGNCPRPFGPRRVSRLEGTRGTKVFVGRRH